jgi:hypothetical protein
MPLLPRFRFPPRLGAFVFAGVLGLHGFWVLAAALERAMPPPFPNTDSAPQRNQARARTAAQFGVVRGDLWADDALWMAASTPLAVTAEISAPVLAELGAAASRAASRAPHDSRLWLLLAAVESRRPEQSDDTGPTLKMSYYTEPNDPALMPLRLAIALRSEAIADPDLQILVSAELRAIINDHPALKPAITGAYSTASAPGQHFIESALSNLDPELLAQLVLHGGTKP